MKKCLVKTLAVLLALCLLPLSFARGESREIRELTYKIEGDVVEDRLWDDSVMTRVTLKAGRSLSVTLPEAAEEARAYAVWYQMPRRFKLIQKDGQGRVLSTRELVPTAYYESYALEAGCTSLQLVAVEALSLSTFRLFEGDVPSSLPHYDGSMEKADALLIAGQPRGIFESFGALLPHLSSYRLETAVAVSHMGSRKELHELIVALWQLGYTRMPLLGGFSDDDIESISNVQKKWTQKALDGYLTELYMLLSPTLVFTEGEDGTEPRAAYTAQRANALAKERSIPKLYTLNSQGSGIIIEEAEQQQAALAYKAMASRQKYHCTLPAAPAFTLISKLGADNNGDIFSHVDTDKLIRFVPKQTATPSPSPTLEPSLEPTQEPTIEPTQPPAEAAALQPTDTPLPSPEPLQVGLSPKGRLYLPIGLGLILLMAAALYLMKAFVNRSLSTAALVVLPLLLSLLLLGLVLFDSFSYTAQLDKQRQEDYRQQLELVAQRTPEPSTEPTQAPTPTPTEEPTPEPTKEPTPEPTQAPTATPDMRVYSEFDRHFLNDGTLETVELFDNEQGKWVYRSDILAVEVERIRMELGADLPVTYFVAHIYQREYSSFIPGFAGVKKDSYETCTPEEMAARYKAVLWITGDNLIHAEPEKKGVLIRGNKLFSRTRNADALLFHEDSLSLEILGKSLLTAESVYDRGIENSYSFFLGPKLVLEGKVHRDTEKTTQRNPRCGLGMVEPGHFVAIVADGRQGEDGYSVGVTLAEFAQLFIQQGCTLAYNLDGGVSTAMIFMGTRLSRVANNGGKGANASWQRPVPEGLIFGTTQLQGYYP